MKTAGIILIVIGILALSYQGITYTKEEKILDIGPIEATSKTKERIPLPPILGVLCLLGGGFLVFTASRKKTA